jgi:hypothetical protein
MSSDAPEIPQTTLESIFKEYEPVNITEGYIVVRPRQLATPIGPSLLEIGSTGQTTWGAFLTEEYNPELRGIRGLRKFDQMRKGDAQVRSSLAMIKAPTLGARWYVEPASDSQRDINAADFIWKNLQELMTISWTQVLYESLLMLDFGYWMFETVYDVRIVDGVQRIICKKLAPRHPMHVQQWFYDENGGPEHVLMYLPIGTMTSKIEIPISKLVVFTHQREAGNITGVSLLRSAYKHWYFKDNLYKIDAIQKERHGIGVPIIKLPPNYGDNDMRVADQIGRNLRVNEKAHVVLPPLWEIAWAKIEGYPVNPVDSIDHHNKMIRENILASLIIHETGRAATQMDFDFFAKACQVVADIVRDTFNLYYIPKLIDYNYTRVGYPKLKYWFAPNIRDLSFALRNFVGADLMRPDDKLEAFLRELGGMPQRDEPTDRVLALRKLAVQQQQTPGQLPNPPKGHGATAGLPRQAPTQVPSAGQPTIGGPTNNSA